jgi:hypothetical protein
LTTKQTDLDAVEKTDLEIKALENAIKTAEGLQTALSAEPIKRYKAGLEAAIPPSHPRYWQGIIATA